MIIGRYEATREGVMRYFEVFTFPISEYRLSPFSDVRVRFDFGGFLPASSSSASHAHLSPAENERRKKNDRNKVPHRFLYLSPVMSFPGIRTHLDKENKTPLLFFQRRIPDS